MRTSLPLEAPRISPPLDPSFRPAVLAHRAFRRAVLESGGGEPLTLGLERPDGSISRFEAAVFASDHPRSDENLMVAERLLKFLLWQRGGWRVYVGGPERVGNYVRACYSPEGPRAFDHRLMGREIYDMPFTVRVCSPQEVPAAQEKGKPLGRHLDGCRIGFDLGASDRKVSAVVDGEPIYSEEVVWEPSQERDPLYHYREIMAGLKAAAAKMERVDAIGGSAAGVYVDNQVRVASLFRGVPKERYEQVRTLFLRIRHEMGVPLEVANDGDVTALAGAMSLGEGGVLGIAMGSSEAGGYVNLEGNITGWLNELAFAPIDYSPAAPVDEWSGDRGCGALYLSQQCVFRLAPAAGIRVPDGVTKAEKLKAVQARLEAGHEGAVRIWQTIGTYLGYAVAHYADFYELNHVLILGRCTSGRGGSLIVSRAREVLNVEFASLAARITIHLPDEENRRIGQAIAAASLPIIEEGV
ncbi:MAG: ROK family protein [Chloroflexota bacterium]|nr:ROK family protein [Chloroflexota bacterium]